MDSISIYSWKIDGCLAVWGNGHLDPGLVFVSFPVGNNHSSRRVEFRFCPLHFRFSEIGQVQLKTSETRFTLPYTGHTINIPGTGVEVGAMQKGVTRQILLPHL